MSAVIRRMKEEDVAAVSGIEARSFADPWSEAEIRSCLQKPFYTFLVAVEDGAVAGYVSMITVLDEGDIANLAVSEEYRRRGLGKALLRSLLQEGEKNGILRFTLEVRESNAPAIALYEKQGFQRIGMRKDYYEHPRENALLYGKETK